MAAGPEDVECDLCTWRKSKAVKSCLVCLASFCETHLQPHYESPAFKKHKLVEASRRLQEQICSQHDKLLEVYCRTDQQCICLLCTMDEHKGHDTISAAAGRAEKQKHLMERQEKNKQAIEAREKELQKLRKAVENNKCSAQTAVQETEKIFTKLIKSIGRRCSELTELISAQEKASVSRAEEAIKQLKQEIADLRNRDADMEKLLDTEDPVQFLQGFQSVSAAPGPADLPTITYSSLAFEELLKSVYRLRDNLEKFFNNDFKKISTGAVISSNTTTSQNKDEDEGASDASNNVDIQFKSPVFLPKVAVKSGEEDEEILFKQRSKLFRWDHDLKQWKERGVGDLKILFHPVKKSYRVLMRCDLFLKVCANHVITKDMELKCMSTSANAFIWKANDYAESEAKVGLFAVKFRSPELVESFRKCFTDCQKCMSQVDIALSSKVIGQSTTPSNPVVFFTIAADGEPIGKITMELFDNIVPKTAENFRALCTGEKGFGYRNSIFHRIIPDFICQGGDITKQDGSGGKCIYGDKFEDENFEVRHTGPGILSMANRGRDTNNSQFFITLKKTEHLDFNNVAFGVVRDGMDVVKQIGELGSRKGKPGKKIEVVDCGQL